jgi:hypothetical protein
MLESTNLRRTSKLQPMRPLGSPGGSRGNGSVWLILFLSGLQAACVPYKPIVIPSDGLGGIRGGKSFFVASSDCYAVEYMTETLEPWFRKWRPGATIATTASTADVVINWHQDPCEICVDCDAQPVPKRASAELTFRTGVQATWEAHRPMACATQNCLPPMLAKAVVAAWEGR